MNKITELQEKRARIWKQAKDFLDTKQKETDVLSAEDNATYEKMKQDVVNLATNKKKLRQASISRLPKSLLTIRPPMNFLTSKVPMPITFGRWCGDTVWSIP